MLTPSFLGGVRLTFSSLNLGLKFQIYFPPAPPLSCLILPLRFLPGIHHEYVTYTLILISGATSGELILDMKRAAILQLFFPSGKGSHPARHPNFLNGQNLKESMVLHVISWFLNVRNI